MNPYETNLWDGGIFKALVVSLLFDVAALVVGVVGYWWVTQ